MVVENVLQLQRDVQRIPLLLLLLLLQETALVQKLGVKAGTKPVTHSASARAPAPAPMLQRARGRDLEEASDASEDTLALERCESWAWPEIGGGEGAGDRRHETMALSVSVWWSVWWRVWWAV